MASTRLARAAGVVISLVVSVSAARVTAAPSAQAAAATEQARRDEAKAAFARGNTAYNLGRYADAITEFEKAYALSRLPDILFNLGQCYRKQWEAEKRSELGRRALHYYDALLREAPQSKVRPDAEQFVAELGPAVALAETQERQGAIAAARGADALKLAQTMFQAGQLADAAGVLDRLLREPGNRRELLAEAYLLRGRVAAGSGDVLAAEAQLKRALELRPSAEITDARPQEASALAAARQSVNAAAAGGLRLVQTPLGEVPAQKPARVDVKVEGDAERMVDALELAYRPGEGGAFLTARAKPPTAPLEVPAPVLHAGARVDYYVSALDEHGGVLAETGTATLPFRLQVESPPPAYVAGPPRWYQKWWLWTIVGAVATGAGVITYVETRPEKIQTINGPTNP
ncbi:MAG TPA: tetratricopeptide repeat protein [Polyangia bacterium]|nr:tetratricopeptide repeat protein [Polyangia bacterium]